MFYMTGFADEASANIDVQIAVTKELGWKNIEARMMFGNKNIASISDEEFEILQQKLQDAGVSINCYGSGIANWAKPITDSPESSYEELIKAAPRLKKLGTKYVRVMSFAVPPELRNSKSWDYADEVVRRMKRLVQIAEENDLLLLHENCQNWGGLSFEHTLYLLDKVQSPAFRLVFDTGNPVFNRDVRGEGPYDWQSSWEFYKNVRDFVEYIHIKDARINEKGETVYTWANEGSGNVEQIITDLVARGYHGGFSMEPHLALVFHDESVQNPEEVKKQTYIEYGRRCEALIRKLYGC